MAEFVLYKYASDTCYGCRDGYADLLVDRYPKNREKLALADEYAKSMESFMLRKYKEGVIHPYFKGYASTIDKVRAALNS